MVSVVPDHVVVDRQEVAVVVGVIAIPRIVMHLVPPPVSLLVAVRVDPEIVMVDIRVVDVSVDVDIFEHIVVALVDAESTDLVGCWIRPSVGQPRVSERERVSQLLKTDSS